MKKILLLLFTCYLCKPDATAQKKYNIIYIPVDDMSIAFDLYGNPYAKCPNIARLAQHGVLFRQCYTQYSLCNPSRTSTFSGLRPDSTGVTDNDTDMRSVLGSSFRFLNEYFHDYSYRTESFGKFTCEHETEVSWDAFYISDRNLTGGSGSAESKTAGEGRQLPSYYIDTVHTLEQLDDGIETSVMIRRLQRPVATPYFYNLGLQAHNPFAPVADFWNKTGDSVNKEYLPMSPADTVFRFYGNGSGNIPISQSPDNDTADIPSIALKYLIPYPPKEQQRIRHSYYSEMMEVDANLGKVLDVMDQMHLWDSSIVVFYSDHGLQMGEHDGLWLKIALYEETQRVPFIICAPGIKPGVSNELVELVDIFPTLTELCGIPAPANCQGSSLVPLLQNPNAPWKKAIFSQLRRNDGNDTLMGRAVRTKTFHYNSWQSQGEELYYLVNDSTEFVNLAENHPEALDSLKKMRKLLDKGWQNAKPPVYKKRAFFRDVDGDGYGNKTDSIMAYFSPDGYVSKKGDCNDNNFAVHPDITELSCNGIDDNCNNKTDENNPTAIIVPSGSLDICVLGYVDLIANDGSNLTYQWKKNNVDIPGATQRVYRATKPGKYKVVIRQGESCVFSSKNVIVTNTLCENVAATMGAQREDFATTDALTVFPNPVQSMLHITYKSIFAETVQLRVYDIAGKTLLYKPETTASGSSTYDIDVSGLSQGTYYLELKNSATCRRVKFVIEK